MKKIFSVRCELGDGIPDYTFIVKANDLAGAYAIARAVAETDYKDSTEVFLGDITVNETTPEKFIEENNLTFAGLEYIRENNKK